MASERLRELQELEQQLQRDSTVGEIQPAQEVTLGAGSFRVADGTDKDFERSSLLRRRAGKEKSGIETWKICSVVGVTIVSCLALLWVLFSGATPDKFTSSPSLKSLTAKELQQLNEEGHAIDSCPDLERLPPECLDEQRTRSKSSLEYCNEFLEDHEYSLDLLKKCGIIKSGD